MKNQSLGMRLLVTCTIVGILTVGCGGGGGGNSAPVVEPSAVFDLRAAQNNLYQEASFNLNGSDNLGNNYKGTMAFSSDGAQDVNGTPATAIKLELSLTDTTTNASQFSTQNLFFGPDYAPVLVLSDGVKYAPTTFPTLPKTAILGATGDLPSFSGSDGSTETGTWALKSTPEGGRAKLTLSTTTRSATGAILYEETDAIMINALGVVSAIKITLSDASRPGVIVSLSGNNKPPPTPTSPTTLFDLAAAQNNLYHGASFDLRGTDAAGNPYTGSLSYSDQGLQDVNGVNAAHIKLASSISNSATSATTQETADLFFAADYTPVLKTVDPGNVTYSPLPLTVAAIPSSSLGGNSGPLTSFSLSDGTSEAGTWQLDLGNDGQAVLVFDTVVRDSTNAAVSRRRIAITIDAAGTVYALRLKVTDSSGTVVTLSGNKL